LLFVVTCVLNYADFDGLDGDDAHWLSERLAR
jgi:hypothetical protein